MSSLKLAGIAVAVIAAVSIIALVRPSRAQPTNTINYQPETMKDFKKPAATELKKKLSAEHFNVTQSCGTETPFRNAYWDNHAQ